MQGQALPSRVEVLGVPSSQPRSAFAAKAKDSLRRDAEPPFEVMPISVWSPPAHSTRLPSSILKYLGRECFGVDGDEDSLFSNTDLVASAISSVLKDSDLKRSMPCLLRRLWLYHSKG